jgi:hypothetical protein
MKKNGLKRSLHSLDYRRKRCAAFPGPCNITGPERSGGETGHETAMYSVKSKMSLVLHRATGAKGFSKKAGAVISKQACCGPLAAQRTEMSGMYFTNYRVRGVLL